MPVTLAGKNLTIEDVVSVARGGAKVELAPAALERIKMCRGMLEEKIAAHEIMYGINTGIGEFSEVVLTDEQVKQFQRYLIYNHAAGHRRARADRARARRDDRPHQRARARQLRLPAGDHADLRRDAQQGVTPVVCEKGSVGACGDLAPMSQIALSLMGEGEAFYQGERMPTAEAMERAGIPIPGLQARDGLAAINGSNVLTGDELPAPLRHRALAQAGRDRGGHVARGAARQHEAVRGEAARAARLPRRGHLRRPTCARSSTAPTWSPAR